MSSWQFSFPASRTCLWDTSPAGEGSELYLTRNGWLCVRISSATLKLAHRHAKQSHRKLFDCFLIASSWIHQDEGLCLEVDRFDPGRPSGCGLTPTTLIPGDLPIPTQITTLSHPDGKHLVFNLETLRQAVSNVESSLCSPSDPLDPALLLSLRISCSALEDGSLAVECACVYPGATVLVTPIQPIAIVQTALARNLGGPLSLSAIQGKTKHGYITMETSRKLVLLLHSDPKAAALPLVGIWVSGVGSIHHPSVWCACLRYTHSSALADRVWASNSTFLAIVYLQGSTKPEFMQCSLQQGERGTAMASGDNSLPSSSTSPLVSFQLYPVQESTALHTLLEATSSPVSTSVSCDPAPLPSPQPTPTQVPPKLDSDRELSMMSVLSTVSSAVPQMVLNDDKENTPQESEEAPTNQSLMSRGTSVSPPGSLVLFPDKLAMTPRSENTRKLLKQQEIQLKALQEQVNTLLQAQSLPPVQQSQGSTPKAEASTSTGESLYWGQADTGQDSVCSSMMSVQTAISVVSHSVSDMQLDLHSYAQSPTPPGSPSYGESASQVDTQTGQQQFYENMLLTVNALLSSQDSPPPEETSTISTEAQSISTLSNTPVNIPPDHSSVWSQTRSQTSYHCSQYSSQRPEASPTNSTLSHTSNTPTANSTTITSELPLLHPAALQHAGPEISLLPVPRIVAPVSQSTVIQSECTLDEHMGMADVIAMKYLGNNMAAKQPLLAQDLTSLSEGGSAHMSMATEQYLQRHKLLGNHGNQPPHNTIYREDSRKDDNILNIERLKQLPKLI